MKNVGWYLVDYSWLPASWTNALVLLPQLVRLPFLEEFFSLVEAARSVIAFNGPKGWRNPVSFFNASIYISYHSTNLNLYCPRDRLLITNSLDNSRYKRSPLDKYPKLNRPASPSVTQTGMTNTPRSMQKNTHKVPSWVTQLIKKKCVGGKDGERPSDGPAPPSAHFLRACVHWG